MSHRIAYLLKKFPRLSETFILNEVLAQEERGSSIHVFSRRSPDDEPRHPQLQRLKAQVEVLPSVREIDPWTELFVQQGSPLVEAVGRTARDFSAYGHPRFGSLLAEAVWLYRRCRELEIDHIHVHFATDAALVASMLLSLGGPGYSLTMHAKDIYRDGVNPLLLDRMVADSEFSVTVCDANVQHLRSLLTPSATNRIRRLYNGIDLNAFASNGAPREAAHVLSVGRLVEKKGFLVLVEALSLLVKSGMDVRATFVGEGEDRARIVSAIEAAGLSQCITLTGGLTQDQTQALMTRATVLCLPCQIGVDGNRDALPTVLVEALANGLPVVSTSIAGVPEIIDHGRAGILVPAGDPSATADALKQLLGDTDRRAELAQAGLQRSRELFDLQETSTTLKQWFDALAVPGGAACTSPA